MLWLLDIRHDPSAEDQEHGELLAASGVPALVAITKADKLPFGQRKKRLRELSLLLGFPEEQVQPTSSTTGEGLAELAETLLALESPKE